MVVVPEKGLEWAVEMAMHGLLGLGLGCLFFFETVERVAAMVMVSLPGWARCIYQCKMHSLHFLLPSSDM